MLHSFYNSLNRAVVSHSNFLKSPHGQNDSCHKISMCDTCIVRIIYIGNNFKSLIVQNAV